MVVYTSRMLSSGLESIWYVMPWLYRYLFDLGVFKYGFITWPSYLIFK